MGNRKASPANCSMLLGSLAMAFGGEDRGSLLPGFEDEVAHLGVGGFEVSVQAVFDESFGSGGADGGNDGTFEACFGFGGYVFFSGDLEKVGKLDGGGEESHIDRASCEEMGGFAERFRIERKR